MPNIGWVLLLLVWAFLAALCYNEIVEKVLEKAETAPSRLFAHVLCAILATLVAFLLPISWVIGKKK